MYLAIIKQLPPFFERCSYETICTNILTVTKQHQRTGVCNSKRAKIIRTVNSGGPRKTDQTKETARPRTCYRVRLFRAPGRHCVDQRPGSKLRREIGLRRQHEVSDAFDCPPFPETNPPRGCLNHESTNLVSLKTVCLLGCGPPLIGFRFDHATIVTPI